LIDAELPNNSIRTESTIALLSVFTARRSIDQQCPRSLHGRNQGSSNTPRRQKLQ